MPPTHTLARVHPAQVEQQHQASSVPWVLGRLPHPAGGKSSYSTVGPGASSQPIDFSLKLPGSPRCPRATLALPAIVRPPPPTSDGNGGSGGGSVGGSEVTSLPSGEHRPPHTHLASPVNRALRGIAETHVFIPSHFVQILQDLEEKRKHGRHPMREDP